MVVVVDIYCLKQKKNINNFPPKNKKNVATSYLDNNNTKNKQIELLSHVIENDYNFIDKTEKKIEKKERKEGEKNNFNN